MHFKGYYHILPQNIRKWNVFQKIEFLLKNCLRRKESTKLRSTIIE